MHFNFRTIFSPRLSALALIVLVLGFILKFDLWREPETEPAFVVSTSAKAESVNSRSPASVAKDVVSKDWEETDKMLTVNWDCSSSNKFNLIKNIQQLRLSGTCLKKLKKVVNTSNGYTANLFQIDQSFTTDFLSLNEGINKLSFEWDDGASANSPKTVEIIVKKQ